MPAISINPFSDAYDSQKQTEYLDQVIKGEKKYKPGEMKDLSPDRKEVLMQALKEIKTSNNAQAIVKYRLVQELKTSVPPPENLKADVSVKVTKKTDTLYRSTFTVASSIERSMESPPVEELIASAKKNDLERVKYICSMYAQLFPDNRVEMLTPELMHDLAKISPQSFECVIAIYPPENLYSMLSKKIDDLGPIGNLFKYHPNWLENPKQIVNPHLKYYIAWHALLNDHGYLTRNFKALNLEESLRMELYKKSAELFGCDTTLALLQKGGVKDYESLLEIAKIAAAHSSGDISTYIGNFGFKDQKDLIEIAKIAAAHTPNETSYYIQRFGIKDQSGLIAIAKIAAAKDGEATSRHIEKYGINDQNALIDIAKIVAQNYYRSSEYIQNFGITDENALIEIAKLAAGHHANQISKHIQNYGITDKDALVEIAKIVTREDKSGNISQFIQNYGISDQNDLIEIAKIAAKYDASGTSIYIQNYDIQDHNALIEIAKIAAQNDKTHVTLNCIQFFGISKRAEVFAISLIAIESLLPSRVKSVNIHAKFNEEEFKKIINRLLRKNPIDTLSRVVESKSEVIQVQPSGGLSVGPQLSLNEQFPGFLTSTEVQLFTSAHSQVPNEMSQALSVFKEDYPGLDEALKKIELIENPDNKLNALTALSTFVLWARTFDDQQLVKERLAGLNVLQQIVELRESQIRIPLVNNLINTLSSKERFDRVITGHTPKNLLLRLQMGALVTTKAELDLHVQNLKSLMTDQTALTIVLSTLGVLISAGDLSEKAIQASIKSIFKPPIEKLKVLKECRLLKGILMINGATYLNEAAENENMDLFAILGAAIKEKAPFITEIPSFSEKYAETFLQSRNPAAVLIYIACLSSLQEPVKTGVDKSLKRFVTAVFDGTFEIERRNPANNPHLEALAKDHKEILDKFHKGERVVENIVEGKEEAAAPIHLQIKAALYDAIMTHKHLTDAGLNDKIAVEENERGLKYLQNLDQPDLAQLQIRLEDLTKKRMEAAKDKSESGKKQVAVLSSMITYLKLQQNILNLMKPDLKKDEVKKLIGDINVCLKDDCAFRGDLALIESMFNKVAEASSTVTVEDTSDPHEFLPAGTEVLGSCQKIDGNPMLNRGLLGYMLNGQDRLIVLKDGDATSATPMKGRALYRLLLDDSGKPVLHIEPIYPQTLETKYKDKIYAMAIKKAKALGIPLLRVTAKDEVIDEKLQYGKAIRSLGGCASEYVDSVGGIQEGAVYTINNPYVIFQPAVVTA